MGHHLEALADAGAVARTGAAFVAEQARQAVGSRGEFHFAVSGGHTPWAMFAELVSETVPWEKVVVYQVDERVAPPGDPDRNLHHLRDALRSAAARIEAMPVNDEDLDRAAASYAATLPEHLDLVHLGLGPDGHTASLVPGDPVLSVTDRMVALTQPYQGRVRMTLTYPPGPRPPDPLARHRARQESRPEQAPGRGHHHSRRARPRRCLARARRRSRRLRRSPGGVVAVPVQSTSAPTLGAATGLGAGGGVVTRTRSS
jgi:6-phosphogluconolactonase